MTAPVKTKEELRRELKGLEATPNGADKLPGILTRNVSPGSKLPIGTPRMTSQEQPGWLRRTLTAIGRALKRGILGKSSDEYMKQFTRGDKDADRAEAARLAWPRENSRDAPRPHEMEYEPVHGWTTRQRDYYLERNPGYRAAYEARLQDCSGGNGPPT